MKDWHRFMLLERLDPANPLGQANTADAAVVDWSNTQNKYVLTGEIITVHEWQGRHFGLPYECGWAKCTDASKPEVVSLGGTFRHGKLKAQLNQGQTAQVSIWNASQNAPAGTDADTGYSVTARDFLLPPNGSLASGTSVCVRYDELSMQWYVVSWSHNIWLGKPAGEILYGQSGTVTIYAGPQGTEAPNGMVVTAANYLTNVNANEFVFVEQRDNGTWVIIARQWEGRLLAKTTTKFGYNDQHAVTVYTGTPGSETATLITVNAQNKLYNYIPAERFVWIATNGVENAGDGGWYIVSAQGMAVLGKAKADIDNSTSGTVNVYTTGLPPGQGLGNEAANGDTITAYNRNFGYIPAGTWLICVDDGDGFYVASVKQGDHFYCKVVDPNPPSAGEVNGWAVGTTATVEIQVDNAASQTTGIQIQAWVRLAPVITGEPVGVVWTGNAFTIFAGGWDGGIAGINNTSLTVAKGTSSQSFAIDVAGNTNPTKTLLMNVAAFLGDIGSEKKVRINRNWWGFTADSAEC